MDSTRDASNTTAISARTPVSWRRLRGTDAAFALGALVLSAIGPSLAALVAGRLAEHPSSTLVVWLAVLSLGGAALNTLGQFLWASAVDRAAGALRQDLVDAVLHQPLSALSETAVGEVLDRVDDDTHEVNNLVRQLLWPVLRTSVAVLPMWIVAGFSWWPAWVMFPVVGVMTFLLIRPLLQPIATLKVEEEAAWTAHAAAFEEGVAARDDIRTNLGQSFILRSIVRLSATVHEKFLRVLRLETRLILRSGLTLAAMLAVIMVAGVFLVSSGHLAIASLVTLVLVTSQFVGLISRLAERLPDLQAGLGAVIRLRELMGAQPERIDGADVPRDELSLEFRHVTFGYSADKHVLHDVSLTLPAGKTLALVGRTGSGKSTLASLVSRAVEPSAEQVFLGGADVTTLHLEQLRRSVGTVTQKTDILAGSLAENITLFGEVDARVVNGVLEELGLLDWAQSLPDGIDTVLGPGGLTLSAGEQQLIAFARLLVRDVGVVILDEATARMDPLTEARVVAASERLLQGRTGVIIAHRLSTIERADYVAVLESGHLAQLGTHEELAQIPGHFQRLLQASGAAAPSDADEDAEAPSERLAPANVMAARRMQRPPVRPAAPVAPPLWRGVVNLLRIQPQWSLVSVVLFLIFSVSGSIGALTGWVWGRAVEAVAHGTGWQPWLAAAVFTVVLGPVTIATALMRYPRWWVEALLRVRLNVLMGQTATRRLEATPPGEVVARAMDADRFVRYADRWVDVVNGTIIVIFTALVARSALAGAVLGLVMVIAAVASAIGRPIAGKSAAQASTSRAAFGRALVSVVESARTVKLAGHLQQAREHLRQVDGGRVEAAVREHRVQAVLQGAPLVAIELGVVLAWAGVVTHTWGLATALLVANAVAGFEWFGVVAGAAVTEAPGTHAWQKATVAFAGGRELSSLPPGVNLVTGQAPTASDPEPKRLDTLTLMHVSAVHDDGTLGVADVNLTVERGQLVLLLGQVGSGKSSLLGALAGLVHHDGTIAWNDEVVTDPEGFLRPGQVSYVSQTPRVLSGSFRDNVTLGFDRGFDAAVEDARLVSDIDRAGGASELVGHRGLRLSGGQVQRLAMARALAVESELLLADDVSSALDATTELELWRALRQRSVTVIGATSKAAALAQADTVVILDAGRVQAQGPWSELAPAWSHLAG